MFRATEPPVDVDARAASWDLDGFLVAETAGGLHKLSLSVFTHSVVAITLYRSAGFVEEGRRVKHYHRCNGEPWDSVEMGLLL